MYYALGTQKNKPQPPNFTVLDDIIHTDKADSVVSIPFEITGHPEPYLQVFRNDVEISKLSHVLLGMLSTIKISVQVCKHGGVM